MSTARSIERRDHSRPGLAATTNVVVNDIHSRLNATVVERVVEVRSVDDARAAILDARDRGLPICVGGGRHSMGGQQFAAGAVMLDTGGLRGVLAFDRERGTIEVESGIQWPELIGWLSAAQGGDGVQWGIAQKQTGADRLSIGGAVSANIHGRGLTMRPFVGDVEALTLIDASGALIRCSRTERRDLFRLVVGGYGLFGFIASVTLRLAPRHKLRRMVDVIDVDELTDLFASRIQEGCTFGDFQFAIDPESPDFMRRGVFATYRPVPADTPIPESRRELSADDWRHLLELAHTDKTPAFELYSAHYRGTSGQIYWSDLHQLGTYVDDYHVALDRKLGALHPGSEIITELFVPRERLADFMSEAAAGFRRHRVNVVYGTVRLIERDDETLLAWARERWACVVFNLHTDHTAAGRTHSADACRRLIDTAIARGGSYYLTYHRHARPDQVLACHPQLPEFLSHKHALDPDERFQSEWYRCYRSLSA